MTTIVGIFDDAAKLEDAAARVAASDLQAEVLDENIIAQDPGSLDPVGPTLAPVAAATEPPRSEVAKNPPDLIPRGDKQSLARAFRERLSRDYALSDEVLSTYVTTFSHSGKFLLVRVEKDRTEEVTKSLKDAGATRVNRHD
ncbi:MAG TPA: hypothetical protein VIS99_17410 [Terrimicrobiaceae bacterium]